MQITKSIQNRIYDIRGQRVLLDFDLAALYEVETRVLNQAVKRNIKRFPDDFMFQLTAIEYKDILSVVEIQTFSANDSHTTNPSQIVTGSQKHRSKDFLPYAFTEQGVAMLSGVLSSDKAINMNIAIMRAFVDIRKIILIKGDITTQIAQIIERVGEHDAKLNHLYEAIENLLDSRAAQKKWENRERIGFKIKKK